MFLFFLDFTQAGLPRKDLDSKGTRGIKAGQSGLWKGLRQQ